MHEVLLFNSEYSHPCTRAKGRRNAIQNNETAVKVIEAFG